MHIEINAIWDYIKPFSRCFWTILRFKHNLQSSLTWEMLILEPFEPATTMDLKLLYSDNDFWAEDPVLSRASFRMRLTWFSKVCLRVLPGVGSNSLLWAFSMTCGKEINEQLHSCTKATICCIYNYLMVPTHLYHILFGFLNRVLNVLICRLIGNGVSNTNRVTWRRQDGCK